MMPDDHTWAVDQFISEMIKRTGCVISERQNDLFSWEAGYGKVIRQMNSDDRPHLKDARKHSPKRPSYRYL